MKFQIYLPTKPSVILQPFGVNGQYYRDNGINILGHNGIDYQAAVGTPLLACHDGTAYYQTDSDLGHGVVVISNDQFDDGNGGQCYYKTIYWHMADPIQYPQYKSPIDTGTTYQGTPVKAGDLIGYSDTTGLATGPHLHFSLKQVAKTNETPYVWYNLNQKNGFLGCQDATPFFNGVCIQDYKAESAIISAASEIVKEIAVSPASNQEKVGWLTQLGLALAKWLGFPKE